MGSGLFSLSKKHYLPETIRNIQREQKKNMECQFYDNSAVQRRVIVFQKCEVQNQQHFGNFSYKNMIWM